jgi:hypothetical protein
VQSLTKLGLTLCLVAAAAGKQSFCCVHACEGDNYFNHRIRLILTAVICTKNWKISTVSPKPVHEKAYRKRIWELRFAHGKRRLTAAGPTPQALTSRGPPPFPRSSSTVCALPRVHSLRLFPCSSRHRLREPTGGDSWTRQGGASASSP